MAIHNDFGKWGEDMAAAYLQDKGYSIIERDWRFGHRDVDIIAVTGDTIVFVEVKSRRDDTLRSAIEEVDLKKQRSVCIVADMYIKMKHVDLYPRFDVIGVTGDGRRGYKIEHLENAFTVRPRCRR